MKFTKIISAALLCAAVVVSCGKKEEPAPKPGPVDPVDTTHTDPVDTTHVDPVDTTHVDPVDSSYFGIKNYADFKAFADSVNTDASLARFCNEAGEVILLNDIDMSAAPADAVWTPIGAPETVSNANTACSYTGPAFKGIFNGQGFAIRNFKADVFVPDNQTWGIFGVLDGATVKNVVLGAASGDQSLVTFEAKATADAGILVGTAFNGSTILECTNYIPLKVKGTQTNSKRMAVGALVGYACSKDKAVNIAKLVNNAPIEMAAGSNTANGASGVIVSGIVGFCTGAGSAITTVEDCENKGDLNGSCGRSSGIAATMNSKTLMRYCNNRGNNHNDFANGRVGNLACIMGTSCTMDDCANFGECITSDSQTTTAGMVALLNGSDVVITGGGNYGKIVGANEKHHGLLCANFSTFSSIKGVYAGGSCGTYAADGNHVMHELNKDNWLKHIGCYSDANFAKITELSSPWGEGGGTGGSTDLPELKDASLRILFIGNSFTMDAVTHLPGICKAAGTTDITMAHCYYGGRTIPEYYSDRAVANNDLYYANPGAATFTKFGTKASIKAVAESGRWDVITIQEHTGNYRAWSWTDTEKKAIQDLISYVASTQTKAPKVFYIMSQAYFDMNKIGSGSQSSITWTDQAGMYKVICDQTKKVLAETAVDDVIATGTMLQNLRTSALNNANDLTRDGYHMDYGISRYGAACTVFEKIISPVTGKTLEGNSFRFSGTEAGTTDVTDKNAPVAQKAAHYAVEKPFEVTSMEGEGEEEQGGETTLKGQGTAADPWQIAKGEDMKLVGKSLVENETKYFVMTSDIDMSSITDWAPINTANKNMGINFDGQNHKITGFKCENVNYASLFGLVAGTVKNLVIEKPVVSHSSQLAVVAVWLSNSTGSFKAEVSNVHVVDATLSVSGNVQAGFIAANAGDVTISRCSATGSITSTGTLKCVGGILGKMSADVAASISDCYTQGSISKSSYAGGIVGEMSKNSSVTNCYSTMSISGTYNFGGIVGRASNLKNPSSDATYKFDYELGNTVTGCIAWNPSITSTNSANESSSNHYSSGAVVGFTVYKNILNNCYRNPAMEFNIYKDAEKEFNTLTDTPDVSPETPLVKPGTNTFLCPYNGKAASDGSTVSSLAKTLGWDTTIWDLSAALPVLK